MSGNMGALASAQSSMGISGGNSMGAGAIGAIVQGANDLGGNIVNSAGLELNRKTSLQNMALQSKASALNMWLQGQQWNREDTAVQRRVADLKAAGLSPVLAAGSAAQTSSPQEIKAPQNNFEFKNPIEPSQIFTMLNQMMLTESQIKKNDAEVYKANTQVFLDLLNNPSKLQNLNSRTKLLTEQTIEKILSNAYTRESGFGPSTTGPLGRFILDAAKAYNLGKRTPQDIKRESDQEINKKLGR
ncbi:MAG: DNA pilot protein [Arizlama microvirus]|nr:MAG: DNA pilot protein [Arizlama microvirus]